MKKTETPESEYEHIKELVDSLVELEVSQDSSPDNCLRVSWLRSEILKEIINIFSNNQ